MCVDKSSFLPRLQMGAHGHQHTTQMDAVTRFVGCSAVNHFLLSCVHVSTATIGCTHTRVSGDL